MNESKAGYDTCECECACKRNGPGICGECMKGNHVYDGPCYSE